jgi:hypothetical protein
VPGADFPTGTVLSLLSGHTPPDGFVFLGTQTLTIRPACSKIYDDDRCGEQHITVNVYVKQ